MLPFLRNLSPYYRSYRGRVFLGLFFSLVGNMFTVAGPWYIRLAINGLQTSITHQKLWTYAGMILLVAAASGLFRFFTRRLVIGVSRFIEYDMRQKLIRHLLKLEPAFFDRSRVGDLMTRSTSDIEQVRMVVGPALMYMTGTVTSFIFALVLMAKISPKMTTIVLFIAPLMGVLVYFLGRLEHKASAEAQAAFSDISAMVQENLAGIRVVKAFRQIPQQEAFFARRSDTLRLKNLKMVFIDGSYMPLIMLVMGSGIAGILLVGGQQIIAGKLLVGDFVAFISYLMMLAWPMISTGWVVSLLQRGRASLERIHHLLDREPRLVDPVEGAVVEPRKPGTLEFGKVSFRYPETDVDVLREVSFKVKSGGTLGIVGRVGCGKSTIAHLLTRMYATEQGKVRVEGVDMRDWESVALRKGIAVVPQDPLLFSTSIRENINLGGDYSDAELDRAVEISRLVQDIPDFPNGLETEVGERGITLSGGQKQRVAIARALIRDPRIVIFDDALSAVDAETEEMILKNFKTYLKNRTTVIISHRVTSVANADEIIVMDRGEILERGTHADLVRKRGAYAQLFREQRISAELEDAA
ncbi:MAG: ABC transporter ATP-binding protein [bacterium]